VPELPEVETVKKGLGVLLKMPVKIEKVKTSRKALRFPYPRGWRQGLSGLTLRKISRRAKYLVFDFGEQSLICHLGMTGNWREDRIFQPQTHDHIHVRFEDGTSLIYNDVRRFGYVDLLPSASLMESRWFAKLGPEPFQAEGFTLDWLYHAFQGRTAPVKSLIMNQEVVVGVGNIYASEALFQAGLHPKRAAGRISKVRVGLLVEAIEKVIKTAIQNGGSTIRDFKNAGGSAGYFQTQLQVYGRAKQPCRVCQTPIRSAVVAGRSTFWCSKCQK